MWYNDLRPTGHLIPNKFSLLFIDPKTGEQKMEEAQKKRTIDGLIRLKKGILDKIPRKKVDDNILLASWNIKEFGHLDKRLPESYYYIAEIINAFDIVAIQEIKSSLKDLEIVMRILGSDWSYVITDITEGTDGNKERFGYIYDTRRVKHSGLSGEVVIPPEVYEDSVIDQLKRTPSIIGFQSGWKKFTILNLHLHPGEGGATDDELSDHDIRKAEIALLMKVLADKKKKGKLWNENLIILGDTNLYKEDEDIVDLIRNEGFKESDGLIGKMTNTSLNQIYDRIFLGVDNFFKLMKDEEGKEKADVFKLFDYVLSEDMIPDYHTIMKAQKGNPDTLQTDADYKAYFNRFWKRNQISDHLPVWIEIDTDSSPEFLRYIGTQF
ncbi:endonuclease/exonuclease/phosphatase family protein [Spongiimicrobium salis]|uniref:endonuclease/exonuclease/phosphatase family protein n=1 Tax=Spongiimicrobium salis TaxID=1667022 RepID=UPI00374D8390